MFLGFGITGGGTLLEPLADGDDEQDDDDAMRGLESTTVMVYSSG